MTRGEKRLEVSHHASHIILCKAFPWLSKETAIGRPHHFTARKTKKSLYFKDLAKSGKNFEKAMSDSFTKPPTNFSQSLG